MPGTKSETVLNQGETDSVEMKEESDRDVSCHLYYLTYMDNI
jgi:hypothetical protein